MSVPHLLADMVLQQPPPPPGGDGGIPGIPKPTPTTPPGLDAMMWIVGGIMTIAGLGIVGLFFGGIIKATIGRSFDHHGSGRSGANLIIVALVLALVWGLGYGLISQMATAGSQ